jgi:hypothetical protein
MAVGDRDRLHLRQIDPHGAAVVQKGVSFRAHVEQHHVLGVGHPGAEPQAIAEVGDAQGLSGNHLGAGGDDVGQFRRRERRLGDVGIADVVGEHVDHERVDRDERRPGGRGGLGRFGDKASGHDRDHQGDAASNLHRGTRLRWSRSLNG